MFGARRSRPNMVNAADTALARLRIHERRQLFAIAFRPNCINQDRIWVVAARISHCDCRRRGAKLFGNHSSGVLLYGKPGEPGVPVCL
jgi:hypothetical protein